MVHDRTHPSRRLRPTGSMSSSRSSVVVSFDEDDESVAIELIPSSTRDEQDEDVTVCSDDCSVESGEGESESESESSDDGDSETDDDTQDDEEEEEEEDTSDDETLSSSESQHKIFRKLENRAPKIQSRTKNHNVEVKLPGNLNEQVQEMHSINNLDDEKTETFVPVQAASHKWSKDFDKDTKVRVEDERNSASASARPPRPPTSKGSTNRYANLLSRAFNFRRNLRVPSSTSLFSKDKRQSRVFAPPRIFGEKDDYCPSVYDCEGSQANVPGSVVTEKQNNRKQATKANAPPKQKLQTEVHAGHISHPNQHSKQKSKHLVNGMEQQKALQDQQQKQQRQDTQFTERDEQDEGREDGIVQKPWIELSRSKESWDSYYTEVTRSQDSQDQESKTLTSQSCDETVDSLAYSCSMNTKMSAPVDPFDAFMDREYHSSTNDLSIF